MEGLMIFFCILLIISGVTNIVAGVKITSLQEKNDLLFKRLLDKEEK